MLVPEQSLKGLKQVLQGRGNKNFNIYLYGVLINVGGQFTMSSSRFDQTGGDVSNNTVPRDANVIRD